MFLHYVFLLPALQTTQEKLYEMCVTINIFIIVKVTQKFDFNLQLKNLYFILNKLIVLANSLMKLLRFFLLVIFDEWQNLI